MCYEVVFHLIRKYLYLKVCLMILCYTHTGWCIYSYDTNYLNNNNDLQVLSANTMSSNHDHINSLVPFNPT